MHDYPSWSKHEGDIGQIHYSVHYYKESNELQVMITEGPLYNQGSITRLILTPGTEVRHSRVNGNKINKIICR